MHNTSTAQALIIRASTLNNLPWDDDASADPRAILSKSVFMNPVELDDSYRLMPGYIKSWKWDFSENALHLEFIHEKFHDGQDFRAEHFEFVLLRPFLTKLNIIGRELYSNIVGIENLKQGDSFKSGMCEGVIVTSKNSMTIKFKRPQPGFLHALSEAALPISPREYFDETLYNFKETPVGLGPYKIIAFNREKGEVSLKKVKPIQENLLAPSNVTILMGEVPSGIVPDICFVSCRSYAAFLKKESGKIAVAVSTISFNHTNHAGKNPDFRRVVSLSLDRDKLTMGDSFRAANEIIPKGFIGQTKIKPFADRDLAKKIFSKLPDDIKSATHTFEYHGPKGKVPYYIAQLSNQFEAIGMKVKFQGTSKVKIGEENKNVVGHIGGLITSYADPLLLLGNFMPGSGQEYEIPENMLYEHELFKKASYEIDTNLRATYISELSKRFSARDILIPLFEINSVIYLNEGTVHIGNQMLTLGLDVAKLRLQSK